MGIGRSAFVNAGEMIRDRVAAVIGLGSCIEQGPFPFVVSFTWRAIEGHKVELDVDCGVR